MRILPLIVMLTASTLIASPSQAQSSATGSSALPLTVQLPEALENQEVMMVRVDLEPGQSSPAHRHHAYVFVYVLSGEVEMRVNEDEIVKLGPGGVFRETPDDVHSVSRNASDTEPASFLAFLIKEQGAPVTVPAE